MIDDNAIRELVVQARAGHEQAMNTLARRVEGKVYAYIYRVTLDSDLTQDISQEVLLTMVRSLSRFNNPDRFWPWLYRIAQSKIQQHFRVKQRKLLRAEDEALQHVAAEGQAGIHSDGLHEAMRREMIAKVLTAMRQLGEQYRAVLSLRCFDQLSYADIATTMDCSEVRARVLFYRAKEALRKRLTRQGVGKGMLIACLGLFGEVTAPAEAAESAAVTAASTQVGLTTVVLANVTPIAALAAVAAVAIGLAATGNHPTPASTRVPAAPEIHSLHFTTQLQYTEPEAENSLTKGAYEQWFYFPEGTDGPLFFRMQRWNGARTETLCAWLQDAQANYYHDSGLDKVYINNYRVFWSSLRVRRLPSDDAEFTAFLDLAEGDMGNVVYARDRETGMLASAVDYRFTDAYGFRTDYEYDTLDAGTFGGDWHADAPRVDRRDAMHKRGWAYFRVSGQLGNRRISGRGRLPFFYGPAQQHPAWLRLQVGGDLELIDCTDGATVRSAEGDVIATYRAGTFFEGLARPWMGMHTLDTVRRDAVKRRVRFMTAPLRDDRYATVTLRPEGTQVTELTYEIDTETDVLDRVEFEVNYQPAGTIEFSYLQEIDGTQQDFDPPEAPSDSCMKQRDAETLWLISLAQNELGS